jgi:glucan 1,3-beta-glucosidase
MRTNQTYRPSSSDKSDIEVSACTGLVQSTPTKYWLDDQDHTGSARGYAPFLGNDYTYPVYRNVKYSPYNAKGDGNTDDTSALQNALNNDGQGGNRYKNGVTIRPAVVFVPGGEYKISSSVDMRLNTILIGDPNNPPVFKATSNFNGDALIHGYDNAAGDPTTNFFVALKNIVIDTTNINKDKGVTALGWGVSQACHLTNIKINMPSNSGGHVGIDMNAGSATIVSDVVS